MHQVQSSHETQCAYEKKPAGSEYHPGWGKGLQTEASGAAGSPGDPCMGALLPWEAGEVAVLPTVQMKAPEATLGVWVPREVPTCCWYLLLGQERAAVGFHLFQSLHEVAVAYLKLFCFVQCRAKLSLELPFFRL